MSHSRALLESPGDSKTVVVSLEEHECTPCVCLLRCGETLGDDVVCAVDVAAVLFGAQLNVSSYIHVTVYLSLTVGRIVFLSHGVASRRADTMMTVGIVLITV